MPSAKPADESAICDVLSVPRSTTYIREAGGDKAAAMELYGWNARISAAFMLPSHFAEVATRNAAADVLEAIYGDRWPWNSTFEGSLPSPRSRPGRSPVFNPRVTLTKTRSREPTTGKVIAELNFAFWQNLFTTRHEVRLWNPHIMGLFPHVPVGMTPGGLRRRIYADLEAIRALRNRVSHHEPIFTRDLGDDLRRMLELVELRSQPTAAWVRAMEDVSTLLAERP